MKIILFPMVTLLLILQGCNDTKKSEPLVSPTDNIHKNNEISKELKSFATSLLEENKLGSSIGKSISSDKSETSTKSETKKYKSEETDACENGGTKTMLTENALQNLTQEEVIQLFERGFSMTLSTDDCIENGTKLNTSINIMLKIKNEKMVTNLFFIKDSTFEELESGEIITVYKNSKVKIVELSDDEDLITESIKASSSEGKKYETKALVSHEISTYTEEQVYEVSGKRIHNGVSYRVDEKYDASKTAMTYDENDNLLSGTVKYYNEKNEHITIKVISENKIKLSIDRDNDSIEDASEIISK